MIDRIEVPGLRVGCCIAVADVVYLSGDHASVKEGLERIRWAIGRVQVVAELMVDGERSVLIRCCPALARQLRS